MKTIDWKDIKKAFEELSDESWEELCEPNEAERCFLDEILDLEASDFFGTEGINKRFS
jgi:uncharacterized cysteine cluster protein YcgN (CxxCxxCC family)